MSWSQLPLIVILIQNGMVRQASTTLLGIPVDGVKWRCHDVPIVECEAASPIHPSTLPIALAPGIATVYQRR